MQKFFIMRPIFTDSFGLTPGFSIVGRHEFHKIKLDLSEKKSYEFTKVMQEGKDRFLELPRYNGSPFSPILIVSENVKKIIEQFKTTKLQFLKTRITQSNVKTDTNFFILEMEYDSIYQLMDYSKLSFYYVYQSVIRGPYSEPAKVKKKITKYSEIENTVDINNAKNIEVFPDVYKIDTDSDIFCIKSDIIVNEFVKDKLEGFLPNQIEFKLADQYKIVVNESYYNDKNDRNIVVDVAPLKMYSPFESKFFQQKMERLKSANKSKLPLSNKKDSLALAENKFNIQFSDAFRKMYYEDGLPLGDRYENIYPDFFYIEDSYQDSNPETFYAIVIAENGAGDALGLLLRKESDCMYDDTLIEFLHENGEVRKYE